MTRLERIQGILSDRRDALVVALWRRQNIGHNPPLWKSEEIEREIDQAEADIMHFCDDYGQEYKDLKKYAALPDIPEIPFVRSNCGESLRVLENITA